LARAAIAEAYDNAYLENQKKKSAPQCEEELGDYSLEVITNQNRNLDSSSSKGGGAIVEPESKGELLCEQGIS
jgi:hypothetical protein